MCKANSAGNDGTALSDLHTTNLDAHLMICMYGSPRLSICDW